MYKALYRKYRPMTFDDVVSQPHITTTLRNQIIAGKTAHAYLFTGSRGTGKTTCARILAKALCCPNTKDGNPCLDCSICRDADAGALGDIIEIDAASNRGVDDVRELREGAAYMAERCAYRIYIIDEVHMLTNEAFNALLKIMEEPPAHVKFILATTEIHKVPQTILSRCQRFDFRRILPEDITERLLYVANQENITIDREAAELIAKTADGGMRDALSLLDQCIAFSDNVTAEVVSNAAGIAGREPVFDILEAAADRDGTKALAAVDKLYGMSKDMKTLCDELIAQLRNVMIAKAAPDNTGLLVCTAAELERIKALAEKLSMEEIMSRLDTLQTCGDRLPRVSSKRVEMEMCLLRLCSPKEQSGGPVSSELLAKIDSLERKIAQQQSAPAASSAPAKPVYTPKQQTAETQEFAKLRPEDFSPEERWQEILEKFAEICPSVSGALNESYAMKGGGYMLIFTENSFFLQLLRNKENAAKLQEAIRIVTGQTFSIRAKCVNKASGDGSGGGDKYRGILQKARDNNIPVE